MLEEAIEVIERKAKYSIREDLWNISKLLTDWTLIWGEQSIAIDVVVASYNCMRMALASPSPNRLVVSEPSDAGLIHHRFHQYSNEDS
jgi:hypothetical protein